jgi:hypothetical protein
MKQETLQEVAERILANNIDGLRDALKDDDLFFFYKGVIQCYGEAMAKWQKENEKRIVSVSDLEDGYQQELFNYLHSELDVIALQSQMHDIERIVDSMPSKNIYSEEDMMTLREKLCLPLGKFYIETSKELEEVADEFAIGFAEWLTYNRENNYTKSIKELLEIYKKEKGL